MPLFKMKKKLLLLLLLVPTTLNGSFFFAFLKKMFLFLYTQKNMFFPTSFQTKCQACLLVYFFLQFSSTKASIISLNLKAVIILRHGRTSRGGALNLFRSLMPKLTLKTKKNAKNLQCPTFEPSLHMLCIFGLFGDVSPTVVPHMICLWDSFQVFWSNYF